MSKLSEYINKIAPGMSEYFRMSDHRNMYGLWEMVVKKSEETSGIKIEHFYERYEDMSRTGRMQVFIENDGDIIITIIPCIDNDMAIPVSAQFCTIGSGGGKSPKVRQALLDLARAIEEDNEMNPLEK